MREIKFRAMTCTSGTFVHGYLVKRKGKTYIENDDDEYQVRSETVGQLTPKQDLNGDNIYEDDLLKFDDPNYRAEAHTKPYLVVFDEDTADFDSVNSMNFMSPVVWQHMEIVGNKHNNPELFEACK